jgi:hypothetical protein
MSPELFEKHVNRLGLRPVEKITLPECEIYVADGFKQEFTSEFPWGYYETLWAASRGQVDVAQPIRFGAFHNPEYPAPEEKKRIRVNTAIREAVKWAGANVEGGRYDH